MTRMCLFLAVVLLGISLAVQKAETVVATHSQKGGDRTNSKDLDKSQDAIAVAQDAPAAESVHIPAPQSEPTPGSGDATSPPTTLPEPSDTQPELPIPEAEAEPFVEIIIPAYSVSVISGSTKSDGTCISIGNGFFITAAHLFDGMRNYRIEVDGEPATAKRIDFPSDVAVLSGPERPWWEFSVEPLEYYTEVRALGLKSGSWHEGNVVGTDALALLPGDSGIVNGDSGGGVFVDHVLVGVIRGHDAGEPRLCRFTPLHAVAALVAPFSPAGQRNTSGFPVFDDGGIPKWRDETGKTWDALGTPLKEGWIYRGDGRAFQYRDGEMHDVTHDLRSDFLQDEKQPGTRIVMFTADWCAPCRTAHRDVVPKLEALGWPVQKVDVDAEAALQEAFDVEDVPTWLVVRGGRVDSRQTGAAMPTTEGP